jgi:flagellar motor switch protein FliN/FliY
MTTTLPYEWLKEVPTALLRLDDIPLLGFPPEFPWSEFNEKLSKTFQTENIKIEPLELSWRSQKDLFSALGQDLIPIQFQIPSLDGDIYAVFAKRDIHLIMSLLIANQKEPLDIIDPDFQAGFIHFLAYEVLNIFNQCNFDKSLNPHIGEKNDQTDEEIKEELLKRESSLCQDVSFSLEGSAFIFRLIISNDFRKSWKEKYAARTLEIPLQSQLAKKIFIPVALEAGKISLTLSEWKQIKVGDFLLLDFCSLDPENNKGRITLTVNGNRFFRARLKPGSIKILEHPLFHEGAINDQTQERAEKNMAKEISDDEDSEFEESQIDNDDDFTFEETTNESNADVEEEEEEEYSLNETSIHEDLNEQSQEKDETHIQVNTQKEPLAGFKPEEINLDIIVEVGRLQMSIQKLTELTPGNILEIDVRPENGVDLVVNGKRIAKGELLKLGEVLGVRILDI